MTTGASSKASISGTTSEQGIPKYRQDYVVTNNCLRTVNTGASTIWYGFNIDTVIVGLNAVVHLELYFMVMRLSQLCTLCQYSHQRETKDKGFNYCYQHHTIKYIPAIALMNRKKSKHYSNFAVPLPPISALISAVTLGVNQGLPAAMTTVDQVLNSLLFGDLLYFVAGNNYD